MTQQPHPVDKHIGKKLNKLRLQQDISADKFAAQISVSLETLKKFEDGTARVGPGLLYDASNIFGIHVSQFFEDIVNKQLGKDTNRLVVAFTEIEDNAKRLEIIEYVEGIVKGL